MPWRDTGPEREVSRWLDAWGLEAVRHERRLPGCPDFLLPSLRAIIFVDGRFWHDPKGRTKRLAPKWRRMANAADKRRRRDSKRLNRMGYAVYRIWDDDLETKPRRATAKERLRQLLIRRLTVRLEHGENVFEVPYRATDDGHVAG